jgi:hypothetical protein
MTPESFFSRSLMYLNNPRIRKWAQSTENIAPFTEKAKRFMEEKGEDCDPRRFAVYLVFLYTGPGLDIDSLDMV